MSVDERFRSLDTDWEGCDSNTCTLSELVGTFANNTRGYLINTLLQLLSVNSTRFRFQSVYRIGQNIHTQQLNIS